eukprot:364487-Chlamydomonas_euryale.AAC.19
MDSLVDGAHLRMDEGRLPRRPRWWQHCWDFPKLTGYTKLIPWPEIRAAVAEYAVQAWHYAIKSLAPLEFKKPH